ncbi:glutamate--tRNA ligase [Actinacidiphila acididurans]|nr:glutamate--tRNA ligase [Actinacidiphila acididurans]
MFHVGGARSALYNWAVARQSGGTFVLRIEDTDAARNKPEWTQGIISALAAIGISAADPAFEGPYFQSARGERHRAAARELYGAGRAYYCDCTREDVARRTGSQHSGYDGYCRDRGLSPEAGRALRFRTPDEGETVVVDLVRGTPAFPNAAIEDFVIARGDGSPVFLLANVVDDLDEGITEVIRGEEHLSNTPKQQLLWQALGARPPRWAHLPVIVNDRRQKLSKRRDKVALEDYLAEGYLPDALVNYLMLLGWGPGGDREIMPCEELERLFRIEDVTASSAYFDVRKLTAFNGEYIRALPEEEFAAACAPWLRAPHAPWDPADFDPAAFAALAPLARTRVAVLSEITAYVDFLFLPEPVHDDPSWAKEMTPAAGQLLADAHAVFSALASWEPDTLKAALEGVATGHGLKLGKAQAPVRVAAMGRTVGLPLFESLTVLGRDRTLARIAAARQKLAAMEAGDAG